jgi:hypothetical protein
MQNGKIEAAVREARGESPPTKPELRDPGVVGTRKLVSCPEVVIRGSAARL